MSIKIPVQADFDGGSVEQQLQRFQQRLNALGQQIAQANKVQFNPVSKATISDLQRVTQQFEALRRVSGDLNRRMNATGQKGRGFLDLDWDRLYPDPHSRARQMSKAFEYVTGSAMHPSSAAGGARQPPRGPVGQSWQQAGVGAAQAGLRAASGVTGGVGGVASSALGTGMSAGFGAGLMGLLGGVLALGVGKLVGMATEKIGQAEDNSVAYDKLKRTLGDVNVSFGGLKKMLVESSGNVKVTFDEAARLTTQFAKLGNVAGSKYATLGDELQTGVGMSRSLGLDPSQGMGFLGTMRGMRQTEDAQGSRRMALLIGETIAKSDAFAKSDEVMEAISGYVTTQTRASHGANVSGYAGMFSAMVGSGIAGMDPAGAAGMLGKINASLMGGGAKGEASQFFTAMVGKQMGLDPLQTKLLREGGAFATMDKTFGKGSVYERATGRTITGASGGLTFLDATNAALSHSYSGNDERSVMMRADATAGHLGIGLSQALALGTMRPNQMGELESALNERGLKIGDINVGGLASLSKVVSGTGKERLGVAAELWGRTGKGALSEPESIKLDEVMKGGDAAAQKDLLVSLVAARDQEMTQGKDIRDSKVAVENIKTIMADKLLPVTEAMRDGIMWMAGGKDGKSQREIREEVAKAEITDQYDMQINPHKERRRRAVEGLDSRGLTGKAYADKTWEERATQADAGKKIRALEKKRDAAIDAAIADLRKNPEAPVADRDVVVPSAWRAGDPPAAAAAAGAGGGGAARKGNGIRIGAGNTEYDHLFEKYGRLHGVDPALLKAIASKESSFNPNIISLPNKNGTRDYGLMQHNSRYMAGRGITDWRDPEQSVGAAAELLKKNIASSGGDVRRGVRMYNGSGPRAEAYADDVMASLATPMPADAAAAKRGADANSISVNGSFEPLRVIHERPDGTPFMAPQHLVPQFNIPVFARPYGRFDTRFGD